MCFSLRRAIVHRGTTCSGHLCSFAWLLLSMPIIRGRGNSCPLRFSAGIADQERRLEFRDHLEAVGRNFGVGWRWAAINIPAPFIVAVHIAAVPRDASPRRRRPFNWHSTSRRRLDRGHGTRRVSVQQEKPSVSPALRTAAFCCFSILVFVAVGLATALLLAQVGHGDRQTCSSGRRCRVDRTHAVADRLTVDLGERRAGD